MKTKWNFQRWINILVTLTLCIMVLNWPVTVVQKPEGSPMAIQQDTAGQKVDFGNLAATGDLTVLSINTWIYPTSYDAIEAVGQPGYIVSQVGGSGPWYGIGIGIINYVDEVKAIRVFAGYSGNYGIWSAENAIPSLNAWYNVEIQFNPGASSVRIVVNGVDQSLTTINAPSGTYQPSASYPLVLGNYANAFTFSGIYTAPRIWNRQRTVAEALNSYNSRCMSDDLNGLVFAPLLIGAAGLAHPDGVALAAGNTIRDPFSGAVGVPALSPVLRAETYLSVCP